MVNACINQVDRSDEIIVVIEPFDKMAQPFSGVGRKMVDIVKRMPIKGPVNQIMIRHRSMHKDRFSGNVLPETAAQIVHYDHFMAHVEQVLGYVGSHESSAAGY
jgi:hypothetical protein